MARPTLAEAARPGRVLRWLTAPAHWLERAKGRRRGALLVAYTLVALVITAFGWRWTRLSGLPDVGDPFDVAAARAFRVPEARNAYTYWRRAGEGLRRSEAIEKRVLKGPYAWPPKGDTEAIAYMERNRPALELWRKGADCPDALDVPLDELTISTRLPLIQVHRQFAFMALVEASRLRDAGDMAGAWAWYRAVLRASRLVGRHTVLICYLVGMHEDATAQGPIASWAADPKVDAGLIRGAFRDVVEANALIPSPSECLQVEYIGVTQTLGRPSVMIEAYFDQIAGYQPEQAGDWRTYIPGRWQADWFLNNEPERSRRLYKIAFHNWLAHCDDPPSQRPAKVGVTPGVGMLTTSVPPSHPIAMAPVFYDDTPARQRGRVPSPAALAARFNGTPLARWILPSYPSVERGFDRARVQRVAALSTLARQWYAREHDGKPPATDDGLVDLYMARLSEKPAAKP
jgi:hypothetical protein